MDTKTLKLRIKSVDESSRTFEGLLSTYGNADSQGDLIVQGAFGKTLKDSGGKVPLLWEHDRREPLGILNTRDGSKGLYVEGKFSRTARAEEIYQLVKDNVVKGLSIGYKTVRSEMKAGIRHLLELKLFEGSLTLFPANEEATVTAVKSHQVDLGRLDRLVREIEEVLR